jgi:hypothetical protein
MNKEIIQNDAKLTTERKNNVNAFIDLVSISIVVIISHLSIVRGLGT